jgi:hypothetical protein
MKELAVYHTLLTAFWMYVFFERGGDWRLQCMLLQGFVAYCEWERYRKTKRKTNDGL